MAVSVIVVSFNTKEKLHRCLSCVEPEHELIVVDNASKDGSAEMVRADFPRAKLIANADNMGFGAANNQGAKLATNDWLLYLNSDCYAAPGAIGGLAESLQQAEAVAGGGKLLNIDGSLQQSVAAELTLWMVFLEQTFIERPLRNLQAGYWRTPAVKSEVDQVMGACLMVKRGMEAFDERFFLYCEDTDLCKRLKEHGTILYDPQHEFTHELGSSSSGNRWLSVARYNLGKELYFEIHHGKTARRICWLLNRGGAALRMIGWTLVSLIRPSRFSQVKLFWRVLTARDSSLR